MCFGFLKGCKSKGFSDKDIRCPRCKIVMEKLEKEGVMIDICKRCNGMWLDDKEIEKLIEISRRNADAKEGSDSKDDASNKSKINKAEKKNRNNK